MSQGNLFSGFLEEFWGCHPISTFRESLEDSGKIEGGRRKLFSNLHCCHHSLVKVGFLTCILFSPCFVHACLCTLYLFVMLLLACMLGGFGRVSFCVVIFLGCIIEILLYCIEVFLHGCAWHYSPLDRGEVAMWGRALVGPH